MKHPLKRVLFIHQTLNGKSTKFWQRIDSKRMSTLEHLWNDLHRQLNISKTEYHFSCYQTKQTLPIWYHLDLLKDNAQILIEEKTKKNLSVTPVSLKIISKKNQLKTYITNRSFVITNKYSISKEFFQRWNEGLEHKNTDNCQMMF